MRAEILACRNCDRNRWFGQLIVSRDAYLSINATRAYVIGKQMHHYRFLRIATLRFVETDFFSHVNGNVETKFLTLKTITFLQITLYHPFITLQLKYSMG